jgi:hypothetical protein
MKVFVNKNQIDLMIWETNTEKRNTNNIIKVYLNSNEEIKQGDFIIGNYSDVSISTYEVTEVVSRQKGNFPNKDYIELKTKWSYKGGEFFKDKNTYECPSNFLNLIK